MDFVATRTVKCEKKCEANVLLEEWFSIFQGPRGEKGFAMRLRGSNITIVLTLVLCFFCSFVDGATSSALVANGSSTVPPDVVRPEMQFKSWITVVVVSAVLLALFFNIASCSAVMVLSATSLFLCGVVSVADVFVGVTNKGVIAVVTMFIIVHPLVELQGLQKLISFCLKTRSSERWPLFKLTLLSMVVSTFVENIPHVAVFTPLIKSLTRDGTQAPSQFLMPMAYAVLLGNFAIVGSSNNLVMSGLMENAGLGKMAFFELLKVNWLPAIVGLAYLTIFPPILLPKHKGGMFRLMKEKGRSFLLQVRVLERSPLVGKSVDEVIASIPDADPNSVSVVELCRNGVAVHPLSGIETIQVGDVVVVVGHVAAITAASPGLLLEYYVQPLQRPSRAQRGSNDTDPLLSRESTPIELASIDLPHRSAEAFLEHHTSGIREERSNEVKLFPLCREPFVLQYKESKLVEVVVGATSPVISSKLRVGGFHSRYNCTILAVRRASDSTDLSGPEMMDHVLSEGDTLLILAPKSFVDEWTASKEFMSINRFDPGAAEGARERYISLPSFCCCGDVQNSGKGTRRLLRMPPQYQYLSVVVFVGVIVAGLLGVELAEASLVAVCATVLLRLMTTSEAVAAIDYNVYIMVAFSFALGIATQKSGLAAVIGQLLIDCGVSGFWLLLVISFVTSLATNIINQQSVGAGNVSDCS